MVKFELFQCEWPDFGYTEQPIVPLSFQTYAKRLEDVKAKMKEKALTHVVIYADREHFCNIFWMTGFDPRFEEAVLVIGLDKDPLIVVGNECEGYLGISPLYEEGVLKHERYQHFSLLNQPRDSSREIQRIFYDAGISGTSKVGTVGIKYYYQDPFMLDIPSYLADSIRAICGNSNVINAADIFMDADYGLRSFVNADEVAQFEYSNYIAAKGVKNMLFGLKSGMSDFDMVKLCEYNGTPLSCHTTVVPGYLKNKALSSPAGRIMEKGTTLGLNLSYWGSNICRFGWIAEDEKDLPRQAADYAENFAGPYFEAACNWLSTLRIGIKGDELASIIFDALPYEKYGIFLNPGHLIHMDEWMSAPVYKGSEIVLHSGMYLQCDIIPSNEIYGSTRMEDGYVLADQQLRAELQDKYPECYKRCMERKGFMKETLGIRLHDDVLPLADTCGLIPPYLLNPETVFRLK